MQSISSGTNVSGIDSRSDQELIADCLAGDQTAWISIVQRYKNLVYSVPIRYGLGPEDAADVFQGVWLELHSGLKSLRSSEALAGWLLTVAARKCFHLRRKTREQDGSYELDVRDVAGPSLTAEWLEKTQTEQTFREVVARLPERCRRLVSMLFYADPPLTYAQAAKRLGLAEGSIGFIRGRCLDKMRKELRQAKF